MKAIEIVDLSGPTGALALVDAPEPEPSHPLTPGEGVTIEVHAAGVSFPEVLQTRGEYQLKPPLPFIPGSEVAGVVRSVAAGTGAHPPSASAEDGGASDTSSPSAGQRVAAFCGLGA